MLKTIRCAGIVTVGLTASLTLVAPASASPVSSRAVPASGDFTVNIVSPITPERLPGKRCKLTATGELAFTGTLDGTAKGTTTAIVFAPCKKAMNNAPGTFRDVFRFEGKFSGTVNETATTGRLTYRGVTAPGGDIRAMIHLRGPKAHASLRAEATVAVGGSYHGVVKQRSHLTRAPH